MTQLQGMIVKSKTVTQGHPRREAATLKAPKVEERAPQ